MLGLAPLAGSAVASETTEAPAVGTIASPTISSLSGCVIRADSGAVLFDKSKDTQRTPASTTKAMTALVACQHAATSDLATMPAALVTGTYTANGGSSGESNAGLVSGEQMTCAQLLQAMMYPSGGDASRMLGAYVGGTYLGGADTSTNGLDTFVTEMNAQVTALGLANTHFINTSGNYIVGHYSSAYDLCLIMKALMEGSGAMYDSMRSSFLIGGTTITTNIATHHYDQGLMASANVGYPGVVGAKAGSWSSPAAWAQVECATRGNTTLYAAVMSTSDTRAADLRLMLDYAFDQLGEHASATGTAQDGCPLISPGTWTRSSYFPANYSEGYAYFTSTASAALTFTAIGKSFSVYMPKFTSRGIVAVYVDDVFQQNVDLYASSWTMAAPIFTVNFQRSGSHTIKLVCTGTKNAASTGLTVDLDYFTVTDSLDLPFLAAWANAANSAVFPGAVAA